jgi:Fe-S cluster assembly protein SufD
VEVERGAQVSIVEDHVGGGEGLVNLQIELVAAANAHVSWTRLVRLGDEMRHIASMRVRQDRDSVVRVQTMNLSGALVRHDVDVSLEGENSECALHGLVVGQGSQVADNHSVIHHRASHARSTEHFRNVLDDRSRAVFAGRVVVEEDVRGTDAQQSNANLLLSDDARVDALPQLEIYNDDVKASHGATLGQLDRDAMFYLRSRGIDVGTARAILTWAFANVVVEEISLAPIRALVRKSVFEHLPSAGVDEAVLGDLS